MNAPTTRRLLLALCTGAGLLALPALAEPGWVIDLGHGLHLRF